LVIIDTDAVANVFGYVLTTATLGTLIWRWFEWLNKKRVVEHIERKAEDERKAKDLKDYTDKMALELKAHTEKLAVDRREDVNKMFSELRTYTEHLVAELRTSREAIFKDILNKMTDMDTKLTTRANLTNGNVSNIRKDLLELSEDIERLYDYNDVSNGEVKVASSVSRRQLENQRKRRRRLDQINSDRASQEHPDISDRGERP